MGLPGFVAWWKAATQYFLPEFVSESGLLESIPVVVMDQKTGTGSGAYGSDFRRDKMTAYRL
jgi:hypothetical protein